MVYLFPLTSAFVAFFLSISFRGTVTISNIRKGNESPWNLTSGWVLISAVTSTLQCFIAHAMKFTSYSDIMFIVRLFISPVFVILPYFTWSQFMSWQYFSVLVLSHLSSAKLFIYDIVSSFLDSGCAYLFFFHFFQWWKGDTVMWIKFYI